MISRLDDYQIRVLRSAAIQYCVRFSRRGRVLSVSAFLHQILMSSATRHSYPKDGGEPEFKDEALRRFMKGLSTPSDDKLADIARFLISKQMLTESQLEAKAEIGDSEEISAVTRYLSNVTPQAIALLKALEGKVTATRKDNFASEEVHLKFELDESCAFVRVTETSSRLRTTVREEDPALKNSRDDFEGQTRYGYGFVATQLDLIYIFVRGASNRNLVNYQQVRRQRQVSSDASLFMIRNGEESCRDPGRDARAEYIEGHDFLPSVRDIGFQFLNAFRHRHRDTGPVRSIHAKEQE